jgi:hypothetical protein
VPGKPHVPFEKVLVLGLGPAPSSTMRGSGGDGASRAQPRGLRVRRCVIELPGRGSDAIEPERAMTLTLEGVGASPDHDAWWVVEPLAAQKRMQAAVDEERRRSRAI